MQQLTQYAACPKCGSTNAKKVSFTWWGGALGPALFSLVKCNSCGTEYNGKTGKAARNSMLIYLAVSFLLAFCVCGGTALVSFFMNN
jgi:predicted nucleic-acid-binding Zn-ribbon protein